MGLLQLSETCFVLAMKTLTASVLPVPCKTRPAPCCPHMQLLGWVQFTFPRCLARSPSLVSRVSETSAKQPAALLQCWGPEEAASAVSPIKVQNQRLLCFRRDCKELVELQPLLEPHRGTAAAGQREVSVLTASLRSPNMVT